LSCSGKNSIYNLESLKSDISAFASDDQTKLVIFSTEYEHAKAFRDSISGVPVVLVPSLTYVEILDLIKKERRRLFMADSLKYVKIMGTVIRASTKELKGTTVEHWMIDGNFLSDAGVMLIEGRNFSSELNDQPNTRVLVSDPLAKILNVKLGDEIQLNGNLKIVGIFQNLPTDYPTSMHLIIAELEHFQK